MKDGRFEIGDVVIGNSGANHRYSITRENWVGTVVRVKDAYDLDSIERDTIWVKGPGSPEEGFNVNHKDFDLYTGGVRIKDVQMPDCCGECFAYDAQGCKFVNIDKATKIWKSRASNCPMSYWGGSK